MSIKSIVDNFNKNVDFMTEHKISQKTVKNAERLEKLFKDAKIESYDLVPASTGEFYFDWDTKTLSFGVAVSEDKAILEYLNKQNDYDSYVESFKLNTKDLNSLVQIISDILYGV